MIAPRLAHRLHFIFVVSLCAIAFAPLPNVLAVAAKSTRVGPLSADFRGQDRSRVLWVESDPRHEQDVLDIRFRFRPSRFNNDHAAVLVATARSALSGGRLQLRGNVIAFRFPFVRSDGAISLVERDWRFNQRAWTTVDFRVNQRLGIVSVKVDSVTRFHFGSQDSETQQMKPGAQIDQVRIGDLGLQGTFQDVGIVIGRTPFAIDSLAFRILVVICALMAATPLLLRLGVAGVLRLGFDFVRGTSGVLLASSICLFVFASLAVDSTKIVERAVLQWPPQPVSRSFDPAATKEVTLEARFTVDNFPRRDFEFVFSLGDYPWNGLHVAIDKWGSIFLVLGTQAAGPNKFFLVKLSEPRIGPIAIRVSLLLEEGIPERLTVDVDGRQVPIVAANSNQIAVQEIHLGDLKFAGDSSLAFLSSVGTIQGIDLRAYFGISSFLRPFLLSASLAFGIILLIIRTVRSHRLRLVRLTHDERWSPADFSKSHTDVLRNDSETQEEKSEEQ